MSAFNIKSILHVCHLYCVDTCHANTYIQNIIKEETLPKYDRTNICVFFLVNEKEESSKVSSIISVNKSGYVEKLPFKPLPLKEGKKKKKKKKKKRRGKRREETISSPKHVAPIIVFADESELDDYPMPITYSSDHDWEKHTTFDIENLFGTNSENNDINNCCTTSTIHVPSNDDMFTNEHTLEDSYFVEFAPTTINKNDYVYVGSINSFTHVAHDKMFYVIVILLILFMMLLKVIMREESMVLCISIILSSPLYVENLEVLLVLLSYACCFVLS
jgi:hypothetical protein